MESKCITKINTDDEDKHLEGSSLDSKINEILDKIAKKGKKAKRIVTGKQRKIRKDPEIYKILEEKYKKKQKWGREEREELAL